ncbi:unnamed protein product [Tuber aestivum]|uniref:Major facilitator superfamily (MFS) profile domain-containing protein n=1 Tax=Tuber aestivum TaxID=59557 RepID=A0A292PVU3_9PEZI|nr:unnamed protein product [Tuber aestivum]
MESNSQTAPTSTLAHNGNFLPRDSNNPLGRVRGFFSFDYSPTDIAWLVPWLCGFAVLLKGFGCDILVGAPITRLIELAVCRQYFNTHNPGLVDKDGYVEEIHCKVDDIQVEMALILGVAGLLSALIELLVSVPLGIAADQRGRRFGLTLNAVGGLCYYLWVVIVCVFYNLFPPRLLVTSSLFYAIGGGPHMFSAFILAMIADVTTEKRRTRQFYVVQSVVQVVQLISPAIGSLFLGIGLWTPFYVGLSAMVILVGVVLVIPETAAASGNPAPLSTEQDPLLGCLSSSPFAPTIAPGHTEQETITDALETPSSYPELPSRAQFLNLASHGPIIPLSLATFFFSNICRGSLSVLLQYVSKRYSWSLSQEGWIPDFIKGPFQRYPVSGHPTMSYTYPDDVLGLIYSKRQHISGKDKHQLTNFRVSVYRPSCQCTITDDCTLHHVFGVWVWDCGAIYCYFHCTQRPSCSALLGHIYR